MKFILFFPNQLGQKREGINKTVNLLFNYYKQIYFNNINLIECSSISLKNNLLELYINNNELINKNYKIINIGGDHSMAIASVSASLNKYGSKLKVLWFDAHGDINTRISSLTGNYHGMPLSFLTGLDNSLDFDYIKNKLIFSNLCYVGIRDLDLEEKNIIETNNIKNIKSNEFNNSIDNYIKEIIEWIDNSPVHISFDVDSLDPTYMEYTGTRSPEGLNIDPVIKCLKEICIKCNVINVDLTELNLYNPDIIPNDISRQKYCLGIFNTILNTIYNNI